MPRSTSIADDRTASPADVHSTGHLDFELANRLFFRLYQCVNIMHKTGSKALEPEGLTTQRWAVMGALSRPEAAAGMAVGDLARYLRVSRQSLAGVVGPLVDEGWVVNRRSATDRRSRDYALTDLGRRHWEDGALPRIERFYGDATAGMSVEDMSHALHYVVRLLENMTRLDDGAEPAG